MVSPEVRWLSSEVVIVLISFLFNIADPGRNGYPGSKGQRGDTGQQGPNVCSKTILLIKVTLFIFQTYGSQRARPLPGPPGYPVRIKHGCLQLNF